MNKITMIQLSSIILGLIGTFLLAFGLRVREGISSDLRRELKIEEKGLIAPSDVRQRIGLFYGGLLLLTVSAVLQIGLLFCHPCTP